VLLAGKPSLPNKRSGTEFLSSQIQIKITADVFIELFGLQALELNRWKMEEEHRLEEARLTEESAMAMVERERAKCRAAMETAEAQQRIAELESQKRIQAEMQAHRESEERKKAMETIGHDIRYRRYTIEEIEQATNYFEDNRKIGEGGYGPVYKCYLDHTPVAIKVLRPDAAQGRSQFNQEVLKNKQTQNPLKFIIEGTDRETSYHKNDEFIMFV